MKWYEKLNTTEKRILRMFCTFTVTEKHDYF